ncbi:OmpA family protein [Flammeovirgaceae bacterium SG7u.111]|nr:OmpA family protein [Flammeovirgaceae bacterium SG7u.132]WPO37334.1 OmpA family protein [Flammeovirgaceae bacterium SG7u.111]
MTPRIITLFIALLISAFTAIAGGSGEPTKDSKIFHLVGQVLNLETSEPIKAKLSFKKLPYYTNIGFFNNKVETGEYALPLLYGGKYAIEVYAEGYFPVQVIFDASQVGNLDEFSKNFQLTPIHRGLALELENINFEHNKAEITEDSYPMLDMIVKTLSDNSEIAIQLEGHTSLGGSESFNMKLSKDRVESIKDYLVGKGINRNRVKTKAFGSSNPVIRDNSLEARAQNRRVEIKILEN